MDLMKRFISSILLTLTLVLASATAHADKDQDRARAALQAGQVLSLKTVLPGLKKKYPGQVLEVELEQENGRWIYEVKLLQTGGQLLKLELDASSGALLKHEERKRRH